jgi:putative transposase
MAEKFENKYRIPSARLQHWDYGWSAAYFVTICTRQRECLFGEIVNGAMNLSGIGIIADVLWCEIKNHTKNIGLGNFVVMPNHVHGIIILNGNDVNGSTAGTTGSTAEAMPTVETTHALSLQLEQQQQPPPPTIGQQRFQNQGKNTLSSIVCGYKSAVTKHANRLKFKFQWQPRFHDHIIRDEKSFQAISNYIENNPSNWSEDQLYR